MGYGGEVPTDPPARDLCSHSAEMPPGLEVPLPARSAWVPKQRVIDALTLADSGLRDHLEQALGCRIDEL